MLDSYLNVLIPTLPILGAAGGAAANIIARRINPDLPVPDYQALELPFTSVETDGVTVKTEQGAHFRVFEFDGLPYSGLTEHKIEQLRHNRQEWLRGLNRNAVDIRYFFSRSRLQLPPAKQGDGLLGDIDQAWNKHLENVYQSKHHLIVSTQGSPTILQAVGRANRIPGASEYTVLLKRGDHEAYLDFSLAPLGKLIRFFAGGAGPVERMNQCIKHYGPDGWREPYANWH